jgi:hypothetical protein
VAPAIAKAGISAEGQMRLIRAQVTPQAMTTRIVRGSR